MERQSGSDAVTSEDQRLLAETLSSALASIQPGNTAYRDYHNLMIGIVEFLFYPNLLCPRKETEINQGRKRIDITMENGAKEGIFYRLHDVRDLPCSFVAIECKNYSTEVANPELDQLAGRFSANRGKFGILCCRNFEDRGLFIERCRDTLRDGHGLIIPLDDSTILGLLSLIQQEERSRIDGVITDIINEVWLS